MEPGTPCPLVPGEGPAALPSKFQSHTERHQKSANLDLTSGSVLRVTAGKRKGEVYCSCEFIVQAYLEFHLGGRP